MAALRDEEPYSPGRQHFILNMLANRVGFTPGTSENLETIFFNAVTDYFENKFPYGWELTWGPKVYKMDPEDASTPPINAWFVATSKSEKASVLAIAGTAAKSLMGWYQDFNVTEVVDWNKWVGEWSSSSGVTWPQSSTPADPSVPYLALGTSHGTANILRDTSTKASPGTYVYEYLQQLPADYTIYVTGHSMGGALAPAVGLGLVQANLVGDHKVVVLPVAGASPGNASFSNLWASEFLKSGSGRETINGDFYNTKDIVPQAWSIDPNQDRNILNLKEIYEDEPLLSLAKATLAGVIELVNLRVEDSGVEYLGIPGESFTSDLDIPFPLLTDKKLLQAFGEQHVKAYEREMDVEGAVAKFQSVFRGYGGSPDIWDGPGEDEA